jgi:hypothetical protein
MRFGSDNGAMSVVRPIFSELKRNFSSITAESTTPRSMYEATWEVEGKKNVFSSRDAYHMSIATQMTTDLGERSPE